MAAVLHQHQLGRHGKGTALARFRIFLGIGRLAGEDAARVDRHQLAQVKAAVLAQVTGECRLIGNRSHAGIAFGTLQVGGKGAELALQVALGVLQHDDDVAGEDLARSGQAQAPNVAKGEVGIGITFMFSFEPWRHNKYPIQTAAPCEGTSFEIGGIALVKGARNPEAAKRYYDWLMSPAGQSAGGRSNSLQFPANKTFALDPRIPRLDDVRLIKYDFEKYGKAAERRRLIERWTKEVESLPR